MSEPRTAEASHENTPAPHNDTMIDPELADLPAPSRPASASGQHEETLNHDETNGSSGAPVIDSTLYSYDTSGPLGITESIAQAPNPRPSDFNYTHLVDVPASQEDRLDFDAIMDGNTPGSPTTKIMKAVTPHNAAQAEPKWPPPPPNASVNLYIGRALLGDGNDNWPLKPNDIVTWIRKNYADQWDGDEGRCSAHRVRTYLARKGADMYYEKLNQGSISGWRIRQNHLWRFEGGGFQGRGMKQEEAIANAQKENDMALTAAHKAAAAEALAAGHPGIKVSMSAPGYNDNSPAAKRQRIRASGVARRKNMKKEGIPLENADHQQYYQPEPSPYQSDHGQHNNGSEPPSAGPSHLDSSSIDPTLMSAHDASLNHLDENNDHVDMDMNMVHQAIQAAGVGNMDELDMGIQLPIEMQMHGGEGEGEDYGFGASHGQSQHPYTPHQSYGYNGQDSSYSGYDQGQ